MTAMTRVLHAISSLEPTSGGPPAALLGLATAQAAAGLTPSVAASYVEGADRSIVDQLEANGVEVHLVGPCTPRYGWCTTMAPTVRKLVEDADIVHIHGLWESIQYETARQALKAGRPYLFRPCGMLDPWSLQQSRLKKLLYRKLRLDRLIDAADALHFTTEAERDLAAPLGYRPPPIVEPNGVDPAAFNSRVDSEAFRRQTLSSANDVLILFLSRLHHKKGLDLLIEAFNSLPAPSSTLAIAGSGSAAYEFRLQQLVAETPRAHSIKFVGMLHGDRKWQAFVAADLFVLPSRQENFGIAVAEALATGTPVVISDQVNIHNFVSSNNLGSVIPLDTGRLREEIARWSETVQQWRRQPASKHTFAERCRSAVKEQYDWNAIARRWVSHYEALRDPVRTEAAQPVDGNGRQQRLIR